MPVGEFHDWFALELTGPFLPDPYWGPALTAYTSATMWGGKLKFEDYLPRAPLSAIERTPRKVKAQTPQEIEQTFRAYTDAHNAAMNVQIGMCPTDPTPTPTPTPEIRRSRKPRGPRKGFRARRLGEPLD